MRHQEPCLRLPQLRTTSLRLNNDPIVAWLRGLTERGRPSRLRFRRLQWFAADGRLHTDLKLRDRHSLTLCSVGADMKLNFSAARHSSTSQLDPHASVRLFVLFSQPQYTLPPESPMRFTEPAHLPTPGRIARKRQHPT